MYTEFLRLARLINTQLSVCPLLYGSLGLERRLQKSLNADDIDVLLPQKCLTEEWALLKALMEREGYRLTDEHEHAFTRGGVTVAFAVLESLTGFAGVEPDGIPFLEEEGAKYRLPGLNDYLKVYEASLKDSYRKDVKNKQDQIKIDLIKEALSVKG